MFKMMFYVILNDPRVILSEAKDLNKFDTRSFGRSASSGCRKLIFSFTF